jgi:hypothetical protein
MATALGSTRIWSRSRNRSQPPLASTLTGGYFLIGLGGWHFWANHGAQQDGYLLEIGRRQGRAILVSRNVQEGCVVGRGCGLIYR